MNRTTILLIVALLLAVAASFAFGWMSARHKYDKPLQGKDTVIVTEWVHDTIIEPKESIIVKTETVYLPVHDTTTIHTTDSVLVDVPITEKTYASELYRATVRGYNPELTDIWVKSTTQVVTVPVRKHWSFSIGPQIGYGFTPKGWQPYAGFGIGAGYCF